FTSGAQRYEILLDCVGNHRWRACRRVLTPTGICVAVGGKTGPWMIASLARTLAAVASSRVRGPRFVMVLAQANRADLAVLAGLVEAGKVTPVIDRRYRLSSVPDAMRYLEEGHARGKVIIEVAA